MKKRIWSLLLALAMVTSLVPAALAAEDGTKEDDPKDLSQQTLEDIAKEDTSSGNTRYWEISQGNYQLTSDITLDNTIDGATYISLRFGEGNSTLDLNGHSITSSNMAVITNQGTLTIKDSSDGETGCVTGSRGVDNYGSLTLESGTIHGTGTSATIQFRENSQNASFTMRGGSVTSAQANAVGYSVDYTTNTVTTITLIGGSVGNILLNGAPTLIVGEESSSPIDHSKITVGKITLNWSTGTVTLKLYSGLIEKLPTYKNTVTYATDTIGALIEEPQNAPTLYHFTNSGVENYYKLEKDEDASPVASIGDEQYYYLPTAVAALQNDGILKLLANYNITNSSEALTITVSNVTLDLNGHNITSSAAANPVSCRGDASGTFKIINGSATDIPSSIQSNSATISDISVGSNSSVTLEIGENVTVDTVGLNSGARMKDTDQNRVLVAPDGNYDNLYAVTLGNEKYIYGGNDLSAIGIDAKGNNITSVTATLLDDATSGISYGNSVVALTVDLGGYVVTGTGNTAVGIPSGADGTSLTVRNGTVHGAISAAGASSKNCALTLEDLTMTSNGDAGIGANGALSDGFKLTLKGCTLTSNNTSNMTTGIFFPVENGVLTIENSTITDYNTGVQAYAGSVTITGADTVITGSGVSVPNLDDKTGKPAETGPIFDGAAVSIIDRNTNYGDLTSVKIEGGSFRTDASDAEYGAVHVAEEVDEKPGTFEEFNNTASDNSKIVQVSGGAFTSSVKEYVTNNLKAELYSTGNGTYTYYDSEESANNAAKPGDAVSSVTSTVSYSVTVVYGNGTATQTFTMSDNATYILPAAPTRPDYTFMGWSDGTTTYQAGKTVTITGDTTFTARWAYNGGGSSSGGSSSGSNRYTVSVDDDIDNGSIRVSPSRAERGDTVTITIDPDEGYELDSLTVRDSSGDRISVERQSDTRYTFEMPSGRVTVDATFTEVAETPETPDQIGSFTDVDTDDWFADAVQYMLDNGMMNGVTDTTFGPGTTTTRGMIVTILYRLEGEPDTTASSFTDVAFGMYYADAVAWAQANSIVTGITETIFAPDQAITREQMAAILYRYAQYKGYDVTASNDLSSYTDASRISAYATTAMQWANAEGLITGNTSTTINPTGNATRAEVATILMRFCETVTK